MSKVSHTKVLFIAICIMWIAQIAQTLFGYFLTPYAILPRNPNAILGIFFAPFIHWSLFHLVSNTLPLLILGFLVGQLRALPFVSAFVVLLTGGLVWLFARDAAHAGASGVVMGYFGFLLSYGFFSKQLKSILISIVVFVFYGGLLFSLLDMRPHISFESHFFGFISGILAAWLFSKREKLQTLPS